MADESNKPKRQFERSPEYVSRYANNAQFELHTADLKVTFGEIQTNKPTQQHTAITMTWVQAKIMAHFLQANIAIIESVVGKFVIPADLLPNAPTQPTPEQVAANPRSQEIFEVTSKMHAEFIALNSKQ